MMDSDEQVGFRMAYRYWIAKGFPDYEAVVLARTYAQAIRDGRKTLGDDY